MREWWSRRSLIRRVLIVGAVEFFVPWPFFAPLIMVNVLPLFSALVILGFYLVFVWGSLALIPLARRMGWGEWSRRPDDAIRGEDHV